MLNLEQKLYQLVISRIEGYRLSSVNYQENAIELVRKGIGGFIFFGGKKDEVKGFIDKLQSITAIPLFIASDIEQGVGQQIDSASDFPCQMAVAAAINKNKTNDVKIFEDAVNAIIHEAIDIGINMPLIPVLDVNRNPDNPVICTRAFSDNPADIAWYGKIYIKTVEDSGLISCAKHFPGHGDTSIDSHISLPVISKSFKDVMDSDIFPFREAIKSGVSSIMIGHLSIPAIDTLPASLSQRIITELLRKDLGYKGLILTDALNMNALKEVKNIPMKCVSAGADILLHPADADLVVEELNQAITAREIDEKKIDTAVERILKYKEKIKNIQKTVIDYRKHAKLSALISDKSITLVKDTPGIQPIEDVHTISLVFLSDESNYDPSPLKKFLPDDSQFINIKELDLEKIHPVNSFQETVVFALFTSIAAWKGSSDIRDEEIDIVKELMKISRKSIVISFGSPYLLRHFMEAEVLIAAYDTTEQAQSSVIKCLTGERDFTGSLPVRLE